MNKFKLGAAHTRGGSEAYILEIGDRIFGRIKSLRWYAQSWGSDGNANGGPISSLDLLPNNTPTREEFEEVVKFHTIYDSNSTMHERCFVNVPVQFKGMCVRVTIEALKERLG